MKNNTLWIVIGAAAILLIVLFVVFSPKDTPLQQTGNNEGVCTLEAKICPDGSNVGRIPPSCEFAMCPVSTTTPGKAQEGTMVLTLNQGGTILGVKVTPLEVVEDSRCPVDVTCIQAGTVRVRANLQSGLGTSKQTFTLNTPITTEAEIITLVDVTPGKISTKTISPSDYRFTFKVTKRMATPFVPIGEKG